MSKVSTRHIVAFLLLSVMLLSLSGLIPPAPASNFTEWTIPTSSSGPLGMAVSGTLVYFTESLGNKIGLLDTSTGVFTEVTMPTTGTDPQGIAVSGNLLYFTANAGNTIDQLNTSTGVFNEWIIPTSGSEPLAIAVSGSLIYFTENAGNKIGEFAFSPVATLYLFPPVTVSSATAGSAVSTASGGALTTSIVTATAVPTSSVTESTTGASTNLLDTLTVRGTVTTTSTTVTAISFNTELPLVQGWNLVSLPVVPNSTAITSAQLKYPGYGLFFTGPANSVNNMFNKTGLASVTSVWTYNGKSWLDCVVSGGSCSGSLTTMVDGSGYWVYTTSSQVVLSFNGFVSPQLSAPPSYSLVSGWNLVGFKPQPTATASETVTTYLSSIVGHYDSNSVWVYDNSNVAWIRADGSYMLQPGQALWILMTTPATLRP